MEIPLTAFEIEVLNKIIPTQALSTPEHLPFAMRDLIENEKEELMRHGHISEQEFRVMQAQAPKNIFQFLRANDFLYEREDGLFFLTEKIKHLRQQGSIEKYYDWEQQDSAKNEQVLETIRNRGYLNEDQDPKQHKDQDWRKLDTLDYPVLDENNPDAHHVHHKTHKFETAPGHITGRGTDKRKTLYLVIAILLVIVLFLFARH